MVDPRRLGQDAIAHGAMITLRNLGCKKARTERDGSGKGHTQQEPCALLCALAGLSSPAFKADAAGRCRSQRHGWHNRWRLGPRDPLSKRHHERADALLAALNLRQCQPALQSHGSKHFGAMSTLFPSMDVRQHRHLAPTRPFELDTCRPFPASNMASP